MKRLHTKFCKSALRVHRKTTNFSVLHGLLRFPLIHNILIRMLTYRYRVFRRSDYYFLSAYILSSCPPVFPLFEVEKSLIIVLSSCRFYRSKITRKWHKSTPHVLLSFRIACIKTQSMQLTPLPPT